MDLSRAKDKFEELLKIMAKLRSSDGCPWDREQTHESLLPYLFEEATEAAALISSGQLDDLPDELGDVLLQIVFHSQIADETGRFDVTDVLGAINGKLIRRHPHVFGDVHVETSSDVLANWQAIKAREKEKPAAESFFKAIPDHLPPLLNARKCQEKAATVGFDWETPAQVLSKVREEMEEFLAEMESGDSHERIEAEFGDILLALVNLSRFIGVRAEEALRKANERFKRRFERTVSLAGGLGRLQTMSLEEMDRYWDAAKQEEHSRGDQ